MAFDLSTAVPVNTGKFDISTAVPVDDPGIVDRIMGKASQRGNEAQGYISEYKQGDITLPEAYLGHMASYGRLGNDIAGEALNAVGSAIPDYIKEPVKNGIGAVVNSVADSPIGFVGPTPREVASYASGQYKDVKKDNPRAARNAENLVSAGSIPAAFLPFKGESVVGSALDAAKTAGTSLKDAGKNVVALADRPKNQLKKSLGNEAKAAAKSDYDLFNEIGGGLHRDQVVDFSNGLNSLRPQDPALAAIWDDSGVKGSMATINKAISGGELSFSGAHALRADVNSQLKKAYMDGEATKAAHLMQIKDKLTNVLTDPNNVSHLDIKAKNSSQSANHEFAKGSLLEDLELLAAKAAGKAQPANSLDTAINGFLNDKKKSGALLPAERAALEGVTKKTVTGELLKSGATRLLSTAGAAVGGVPGFLVGHYGSQLSRTTAEALKLRKLDKVYELINSRAAPEALTHKPPLMLTHDRRGTLERSIAQRKAYEESAGQSRAPIGLGEKKQLALPKPGSPTPGGVGTSLGPIDGMTEQQISTAQKRMAMERKVPSTDSSGGPIRTPVSQIGKLQGSLKGIKLGQFNNMHKKLLNGEISQNRFVQSAKISFGLTETQARSLAKEVKTYGKGKP